MKQQHTSLSHRSAKNAESAPSAKLRPLSSFLEELGVTSITGWRWRKRGWIKTVAIAGRQYISESAIAEFNLRAETGEFKKLVGDGDAK